MILMTGDTRSRRVLERLRARGWGRMFVERRPAPFAGERWGLDNGAFVCWRRGVRFDEVRFARYVEVAVASATPPLLAVLPDIVGAGRESLELSLAWLERLPASLPWFLAVQDGMAPADVEPHVRRLAGLFLGGTDAFKSTARAWSAFAHARGLRFHYARASTLLRLRAAFEAGADSCDSCVPLWSADRLLAWGRYADFLEAQASFAWPEAA